MIKADYPSRSALEDALAEAARRPREPFNLKVTGGDTLPFFIQHTAGNIISGKMKEAPHALVTVDIATLDVTVT